MDHDKSRDIASRILRLTTDHEAEGKVWFTQGGLTVCLRAEPALCVAVAAHQYYDQTPHADSTWELTCVEDSSFWDDVIERVDVAWSPCLDYGNIGWVKDVGECRLILWRSLRGGVAVDRAGKRIGIVADNVRSSFVLAYKTVRLILTTHLLERGASVLHAAVVGGRRGAVAFVGPKGAGKSTCLVSALSGRIPDVDYLANDKILCMPARNGKYITLHSWPTIANVGGASLAALSGAEDVITPELHFHSGGLSYLLHELPLIQRLKPEARPRKIRLAPPEMRRVFLTKTVSKAPLRAVVSTRLELSEGKSRLVELKDPTAVMHVLAENLEPDLPNHPSWLGLSTSNLRSQLSHSNNALRSANSALERVRAFEFVGGQDLKDVVRGLCANVLSTSSPVTQIPRWHFGVYALILVAGRLLLVEKSRGPYEGLLDLPGGTPHLGEDRDTTLRRELLEETGGHLLFRGPYEHFDLRLERDSKGNAIEFRHRGIWCFAAVEVLKVDHIAVEDVRSLRWIELDAAEQRMDLSTPVRAVLRALPSYLQRLGLELHVSRD